MSSEGWQTIYLNLSKPLNILQFLAFLTKLHAMVGGLKKYGSNLHGENKKPDYGSVSQILGWDLPVSHNLIVGGL